MKKIKKFSFNFFKEKRKKAGGETMEEGGMISAEEIFKENKKLEEERKSRSGDPMSYGSRE